MYFEKALFLGLIASVVAFSPDALAENLVFGHTGQLFVLDTNTLKITQRINPTGHRVLDAALSPDGALIAFISKAQETSGERLFLWDKASPPRPLGPADVVALDPRFTRDGKRIMFACHQRSKIRMDWRQFHDPAQILSSALDGKDLRVHSGDDTCHKEPSEVPGSTDLLYANVPCGKGWQLVRQNFDSGRRETLFDSTDKIARGSYSPDGRYVAYLVVGALGSELRVLDTKKKEHRRVAIIQASYEEARPQFGSANALFFQDGLGIYSIDPTTKLSRPKLIVAEQDFRK